MLRTKVYPSRGPALSERSDAVGTRVEGFTLIELLIVIAIIGILASLLIPTVLKAMRETKITKCATQLRELGTHLTMYAQRYGRYPDAIGPAFLDALRTKGRPPVLEDADELLTCPLTGTVAGPGAIDYRGPKNPVTDGRTKHSTPIACDREENHAADACINVLYLNGRVERIQQDSGKCAEALANTK